MIPLAAIDEQGVRSGIGARADHLRRQHGRFGMAAVGEL